MWVRRLSTLLLVVLVACSGGGSEPATTGRSGSAIRSRQATGFGLVVRNQAGSGRSVIIDQASIHVGGGYVAVYEDGNGAPGRRLGASELLTAGTHRDVTVKLSVAVRGSRRVWVILHREDNRNRTFDFPDGDSPATGPSGSVVVSLKYTSAPA